MLLKLSKNTLRLEALAMEEGFKVKEYHSDNGIFSSAEFKEHCMRQHQKYSFSGVGMKHQNGISKRNIKTVVQWARTNMLHVATNWPQHASSKYWPQAVDYEAWVFNRLPNMESGIAPNEIWSGVRSPSSNLSRAHVFGCPVYVLDASLQDGRKIPKWNPCARLGLFLGFSDLHSSLVPLVLNVVTGHISQQFQVIFDDKFETVNSLPIDQPLENQWAQIIALGRECFMDVDYDENNHPILPPLSDIIKSYSEARRLQQENEPTMAIRGDHIEDIDFPWANPTKNPAIMSSMDKLNPANGNNFPAPTNFYPPNQSQVSEGVNDIEQVSEGVNDIKPAAVSEGEETAQNGETSTRPRQNVGTYKDGPVIIRWLPIKGESYDLAFNSNIVNDRENPVPAVANHGRATEYHPNQKITQSFLAE